MIDEHRIAALEINGLEKTYKNGFQALKGISLKVEAGDFFALLGPNGAGKSTTIGVMSKFRRAFVSIVAPATEGRIRSTDVAPPYLSSVPYVVPKVS